VRPDEWELKSVLLRDVAAVDPTIINYNNKWWMFVTQRPYPNTKLSIYHSDNLLNGWKAHSNNPVKTDVCSARPAGRPFCANGSIYRPAQNCAGGYGKNIVINKIDKISTSIYRETPVSKVSSQFENEYRGSHTLEVANECILIDAKKTVKNRHYIYKRAMQILKFWH
jgi:hypothetical protein